ncbi:Uu.00g059060.m01.CDS01 [Anthostomella pinea]|uniref:Uu.00g059060.m01.CDS01 n=1 Tax=Anthostomella pinea TaxID=933095 RepID=A0AAI8YJX4_9PEZI|nr:Uu.00g059060.m01.CDS01 [Anthostomella pinea]
MRSTRRRQADAAEPSSTMNAVAAPSTAEDTSTQSPTVVTLSKIEGPTLKKSEPRRDVRSKLPKPIQFPLVAILSLSLSALGYSLTWPYTKGVIAAHARLLNTWIEVGLVFGWRIFELALGWFGNYDGYDLTALNLLSHGPPLYLLFAHYDTPPSSLLLTLAIESLATYIPFRLLRPLSTAHGKPSAAPNAEIVADTSIALITTFLAGCIYSVSLLFAYATYLPTYLVVYFENLPSVARAHESSYIGLLPATLALGFAAWAFLFTPAEATGRTPADAENEAFDPEAASLAETVRWNFWGWSTQTKVVMQRTALLMLVTGVNTFLQARLTLAGVESAGAAAWASVWVLAAAITGLALGVVGSA